MPRMGAGLVTAVVTSFNPGENLLLTCADLFEQVAEVIVVDDASSGDVTAVLDRCAEQGCTVIRLESNSGIAAALNVGVSAALANPNPPAFVLTIDQDSRVGAGYVDTLVAAWDHAESNGIRPGLVAPESVEGLPARIRGHRGDVILGSEPIQSGLLIAATTFEQVGAFLESLFIDAVDTEFYLRCRDAGLETVVAGGSALGHSLGDKHYPTVFGRRVTLGGREIGLVRSASFRYYYIARNHLALIRSYGRSQRRWAIRETMLDLRHFLVVLVFVPDRLRHLRLIWAGLRDGTRGIGGKIPLSAARIASGH